ncbi:MAG TPA: 1-acyl-sn-glycerol-3-phosphate acyltransferase [Paludibacter sp.]|nr:1-acyl-sn-glycerol-3-phosphate acyltransferase [Paludibacter sp.]
MAKIYENTTSYLICKKYVVWSFKQYFNEISIKGLEHIPKDEPIIFAPNHQNALMDALAILALPPFNQPKVFLARSDLFNLPKIVVKFIQFIKIMPAFRIRDGYENLAKNQESFAMADETLLNHSALCVMPEGNQELERKIRPLVKGIFRIAFSAQEKMPAGESVNIVPVGLDYGDYVYPGAHLIVNIGEPIKVADFMDIYNENQAKGLNAVKDELYHKLKTLTLDLATNDYYDSFYTAVEACQADSLSSLNLEDNTYNRFIARMHVGKQLVAKEESATTEEMEAFDRLCKKYKEGLQKVKIDTETLIQPKPGTFKTILKWATIILNTLLSLPGLVFNIIPAAIVSFIPKLMKIKFIGFYSSVYYVASIVFFPIFYLIQALIINSVCGFSWWMLFILIPLQFHLGKLALYLGKNIKALWKKVRLHRIWKWEPEVAEELLVMRRRIAAYF